MINEERVKELYKVALYDKNEDSLCSPISKYYRKDYIRKELFFGDDSVCSGNCVDSYESGGYAFCTDEQPGYGGGSADIGLGICGIFGDLSVDYIFGVPNSLHILQQTNKSICGSFEEVGKNVRKRRKVRKSGGLYDQIIRVERQSYSFLFKK